jgi:DUF1680 family protein
VPHTDPIAGPVSPLSATRLAVAPLGLDQVSLTTGFWSRWQRRNREVTVPHALGWLERDGSVDNLRRVAAGEAGPHHGMWFSDSDVHKVIEALSWDLGREPSAELSDAVTELAGVLRAAQGADGYLNSHVQSGNEVRWDNLVMSHELYCIGHLIQAGVAHARCTGRGELLAVARHAADCVVAEFAELRRKDTDGHPIIEMALVELYRQTGAAGYLDLARQLIDVRGHRVLAPTGHFDSHYYQDGTPVREQTTVVGHAVRALYLLCGVVDVYTETGEAALLDSAVRQWESMVATKTYLNGAVGSRFDGESFGDEYELPPDLVYGETCATIASMMLSWRLLLATGQSRFADHFERALFNLFAGSTSMRRNAFFYNNPAQRRVARPAAPTGTRPVRADAPGTRPEWFECACCPPNIMRTVASLGAYLVTRTEAGIQVHQYIPATIRTPAAALELSTRYPLDGTVTLTVTESGDAPWTLSLRVPAWCDGATATVNGQRAGTRSEGYLEIERRWATGDTVVLTLPMPVRLTVPHPAVDAVRGSVAVERGPLVYCFESVDQPAGVDLNHAELIVDEPLTEERRPDLLGEPAVVVGAQGIVRDDTEWSSTGWATLGAQPATATRRVTLTGVPYYLWANRGPSVMRIFVPAHPSP